jgi:hypothetical protein
MAPSDCVVALPEEHLMPCPLALAVVADPLIADARAVAPLANAVAAEL